MPERSLRIPSYRLHKPTGQAVVRLHGKDHYLGRHGTEASREKYRRLIAEWLSVGPAAAGGPGRDEAAGALTVSELILAYWKHAEVHYRTPDGAPTREIDNMRDAVRPLRRLYGSTGAAAFGPMALRALQADLVAAGLSRRVVNARIDRVRRVFRWAVGAELVPPGVHQALRAVPGLQRGRTTAREAPGVGPVPVEHVEAALPFMPAPVAAMVRLQLLTGCRPGEVLIMRGRDLSPGRPNAAYRPASHKTAWRGRDRVILLGPRAQEVLAPFLRDDPDAYLFDPREAAQAERCRRARGGTVRPTPRQPMAASRRPPGRKYTPHSYRQAVRRACLRAGVPPWSPLQLRHTAATMIRASFGLEAAQTVLGHARADVTQIYAERDQKKAEEIMAVLG